MNFSELRIGEGTCPRLVVRDFTPSPVEGSGQILCKWSNGSEYKMSRHF